MKKVLIIIGCLLFGAVVFWVVYQVATAECIRSHKETQYRQPAGVVVGGNSQGFGGVSLPLGNITPVEVEVCDEYKH